MAKRLRPAVRAFAEEMETKLREHDDERGTDCWLNMTNDWLFTRLLDEVAELHKEVRLYNEREGNSPSRVLRETADVANFAMMIADLVRPDAT